jgi:hypothetical protein
MYGSKKSVAAIHKRPAQLLMIAGINPERLDMKKFATTTLFALCSLFLAGTAFATPPCSAGSNASCSWTCTGGTFNVTCDNPEGPDRCYVVNDSGSACASGCSDFVCYADVPFNPMQGPAAARAPERTAIGGTPASETPTTIAPATVAPSQRRR